VGVGWLRRARGTRAHNRCAVRACEAKVCARDRRTCAPDPTHFSAGEWIAGIPIRSGI
jgi:hypothetical protein